MMAIRKLLSFSVVILITLQSVYAQTESELELCRQFAFRYANDILKLPKHEQSLRISSDKVEIKTGKLEDLMKYSLCRDSIITWNIYTDGKTYNLTSIKNDKTLFDIKFPASTQLLLGKSLIELETDWCNRAKEFYSEPTDSSLLVGNDSVITRGSYLIESINRNLYYDNGLIVMDDSLAAQSVRNLLQIAALGTNITVNLYVRRFGFKRDDFTISLSSLIELLKKDGFEIYVGVENNLQDYVKASLFAVGKVLHVNHVIVFTIPKTTLSGYGDMMADATLYIPTHNIKSIFGEYDE